MSYKGRYISILSLFLFCVPAAKAQGSADVNIGFGTAQVKASGAGISDITSPNAFGSCIPGPSDPTCLPTPSLKGFVLGLGGDAMLWERFGVGGEVLFQPGKGDYGPLEYRQTFYDFNAIFAPVNENRLVLKLIGGIGGAKTSYSFKQSSCVGTAVCTSSSQSVGSSSHFQLHAGVGVQVFLNDSLFIRPQLDLRYIPNFTDQFGSNTVVGGSVWIGFRTGDR